MENKAIRTFFSGYAKKSRIEQVIRFTLSEFLGTWIKLQKENNTIRLVRYSVPHKERLSPFHLLNKRVLQVKDDQQSGQLILMRQMNPTLRFHRDGRTLAHANTWTNAFMQVNVKLKSLDHRRQYALKSNLTHTYIYIYMYIYCFSKLQLYSRWLLMSSFSCIHFATNITPHFSSRFIFGRKMK